MKVVYIDHRLSGNWDANIADARLWVRAAIDAGYAPVAPYLTTEGILHEPEDRETGLLIEEAIVAVCDELWLCGPISAGMERECLSARGPVREFQTIEEVQPTDNLPTESGRAGSRTGPDPLEAK
jgi:hypothetical protein